MTAADTAMEDTEIVVGRKALPAWTAAAAVLVILHFVFLIAFFAPAISTPDANGYFAQATRIVNTGRSGYLPASPLEYVGMHWLKAESGWYYCRYSPGLPMILAAAMKLAGRTGALLVNPVMASLSLVALFLLVRLWVGAGWGILAVALMAVNPIANAHALGADSHTSVAFFLIWGLYTLERWRVGGALRWALLSGFCFGMAPAIRYPEILLSAAAGIYVIYRAAFRKRDGRSLAAFAIAGGLPLLALAVRNHFAFGAFWRTGYSLTNEQTGFGFDYFAAHFVQYIQDLSGSGMGIAFGLGIVGIAAMCARRDTRARGWMLVGLVLPTTLLYMAYYWAPRGQGQATMRFLVPTFFVYAAAAPWFLAAVARSGMQRPAVAAGVVVAVVAACWGAPLSISASARLENQNQRLARLTSALEREAPRGSVVIAGNAILQHLDFAGGWKLADQNAILGRFPRGAMGMGVLRQNADADRPSPMQRSKLQERANRYASYRGSELTKQIVSDLEKWAGSGARIFWVGTADTIHNFEAQLPFDQGMRTLDTLRFEESDRKSQRGDMGMPGGPPGGPPDMRPGVGAQGVGVRLNRAGAARARRPGGAGMWGNISRNGEPILIVEWVRPETQTDSPKRRTRNVGR